MFRSLIQTTIVSSALAGSFIESENCPVCEDQFPVLWPFSGCDVRCGAKSKSGGQCCCLVGAGGCGVDRKKITLPKAVINLDLEPEERFAALAAEHKVYYGALSVVLKAMFMGKKYDDFLNAVVLPDELRRELQGVATALGVPLKTVLLGEFYYELDALSDIEDKKSWPEEFQVGPGCTGIIAQGSDGTVYHGRNQDYPPPFTPLQYDALYQKGGKTIFEATNFAGIVSIGGTCMVPGNFSVEINARSTEGVGVDVFMADAAAGKPISANLVRQACTRGGDFESAVEFLAETPALGAASYMLVAGVRDGAVITRNATGVDTDVQRIAQGYPAGNEWYLIQDNYDRWDASVHKAPITPIIFGDDLRRQSGHTLMSQLSPSNFGVEAMWQVMSDNGASTIGSKNWGLYNFATIHTEVIVPATGEYHSYEGHQVVAADMIV